ncbi:MAG: hypothetical protein QM820_25365 [Minicystis sp.]
MRPERHRLPIDGGVAGEHQRRDLRQGLVFEIESHRRVPRIQGDVDHLAIGLAPVHQQGPFAVHDLARPAAQRG